MALTMPEWLSIVITVGKSGLMAEIVSGDLMITLGALQMK